MEPTSGFHRLLDPPLEEDKPTGLKDDADQPYDAKDDEERAAAREAENECRATPHKQNADRVSSQAGLPSHRIHGVRARRSPDL
jgi:hypothetical protein